MEPQDFFRDVISLDWDDLLALAAALTALAGIFVVRKTNVKSTTRSRELTESVDAGVLAQFKDLFERITLLESDLKAARITIDELKAEVIDMRKIEEFLQAKVHERDKEIGGLRAELTLARERIAHLEAVCRRAGINGDEFEKGAIEWDGVDRRA